LPWTPLNFEDRSEAFRIPGLQLKAYRFLCLIGTTLLADRFSIAIFRQFLMIVTASFFLASRQGTDRRLGALCIGDKREYHHCISSSVVYTTRMLEGLVDHIAALAPPVGGEWQLLNPEQECRDSITVLIWRFCFLHRALGWDQGFAVKLEGHSDSEGEGQSAFRDLHLATAHPHWGSCVPFFASCCSYEDREINGRNVSRKQNKSHC
jgi:hypothetical protein